MTQRGAPGDEWIEWDAYFLYEPDTRWEDEPPVHLSWGRTIVDARERLLEDFNELIKSLETAKRQQ